MLETSAFLRKTAALAAFSHLETKTAFEGGTAGATGEGSAGLRGSDLMRAYRRLGELQAVARRYPDLESAEIKVEKFFSEDNDEDDEDAMTCSLFNGDEWSIDVTFDKATGRVASVDFEEDDGNGEGDMVKNGKVGSLLQRVLEQDDWAAFAEEIDLLMRKRNSHHKALENAVRIVTSVSERSGYSVRERSTTSDATYFRGRRCIGYTKLMTLVNSSSAPSPFLEDSNSGTPKLVYEYCLRAQMTDGGNNSEASSSSAFTPPASSAFCLPPIQDSIIFQRHNRNRIDEMTVRIAAFAAASLQDSVKGARTAPEYPQQSAYKRSVEIIGLWGMQSMCLRPCRHPMYTIVSFLMFFGPMP